MSTFIAGVRYNDFKGSVAADRSDNIAFIDFLSEKNLSQPGERVVGYRLTFNENPGREVVPGVVVYLRAGSYDDPANTIRAVELSISTTELFAYFKRFDLVMTINGESFQNIPVDGPDY